jgi:hypothetical protein
VESKPAPFLQKTQKKCGTHASFSGAEVETGAARIDPPPVRRSMDFTVSKDAGLKAAATTATSRREGQ